MPKRPTHRHIVRDIRNILGWDQRQLANRLGIAASSVNKIENGELAISRRLALRLHWMTGVDWKDIVDNREGHPQTRFGPLERAHPQRLEKQARELSDKDFKTLLDNASYFMELLLRACRKAAPQKLWAVDAAILCSFEELVEDFDLAEAVEEVKREIAQESLQDPQMRKEVDQLAVPLKEALRYLLTQLSPGPTASKQEPRPVSPGSGNGS